MSTMQASDFDRLCHSLSSASQKYFSIRVSDDMNHQALIIDPVSEHQYTSATISFKVPAEARWARRKSSPYLTIGPSGNKKRFACHKEGGWNIAAIVAEVRARIEKERREITESERIKSLGNEVRELIERLDYPYISPSHIENHVLFKFAENISPTQAERLVDFLRSEGLA